MSVGNACCDGKSRFIVVGGGSGGCGGGGCGGGNIGSSLVLFGSGGLPGFADFCFLRGGDGVESGVFIVLPSTGAVGDGG